MDTVLILRTALSYWRTAKNKGLEERRHNKFVERRSVLSYGTIRLTHEVRYLLTPGTSHHFDTLEEGRTFRRRTTENASSLSIE